jgi:polar amino acid transport system substrate-binding protein
VRRSRSLALLLLLSALFVLTACGGEDDAAAPAASSATEAATVAATAAGETTDGTTAAGETTDGTTEAATTAAGPAFETREEGVLTVGIDLPNPTYFKGSSIDDPEGGFEVDLVNEVASRLGIPTVEWVLFPFNGLVAGAPCPCDFSVGGVSIFPDRQEVVDFSAPYYTVNQAVLVRKGTAVADAAAAKALQFGSQKDSSGLYYLETTLKPTKPPRVYPSTTAALLALSARQVEAVILDANIVADEAAKKPNLEVVGQFETEEQIGAVLKKGSPNTAVLSEVIEGMRSDGFLDDLVAKHFTAQADVPVLK